MGVMRVAVKYGHIKVKYIIYLCLQPNSVQIKQEILVTTQYVIVRLFIYHRVKKCRCYIPIRRYICWPSCNIIDVLTDSHMTHRPRPRNRWNIICVHVYQNTCVPDQGVSDSGSSSYMQACVDACIWLLRSIPSCRRRIRRQSKLIPLVLCECSIYIFFGDRSRRLECQVHAWIMVRCQNI